MNMSFNFSNPTNLIFGAGKLDTLGEQKLPGKKALLLISNGKSTKANGYLDRTTSQLEKAGADYVVYAGIMENPVKEAIMEGASVARENNCDFIVALGGGAVLDSSAAISAMATNSGDLWDYVFGGTGKCQPLKNPGLPIVAIATTSGTGSEMNGFGVISNLETKEKIGFGDPGLTPVLAIVDPELMTTVPAKYTAYQGFDALFHNTEVMISKAYFFFRFEIRYDAKAIHLRARTGSRCDRYNGKSGILKRLTFACSTKYIIPQIAGIGCHSRDCCTGIQHRTATQRNDKIAAVFTGNRSAFHDCFFYGIFHDSGIYHIIYAGFFKLRCGAVKITVSLC